MEFWDSFALQFPQNSHSIPGPTGLTPTDDPLPACVGLGCQFRSAVVLRNTTLVQSLSQECRGAADLVIRLAPNTSMASALAVCALPYSSSPVVDA